MIKIYISFLSLLLFYVNAPAHEVPENSANITIQHGSVHVNLSIHPNSWTNKFVVHKLDDEILKYTKLTINSKELPLKLRKIEKKSDHYSIQYSASKGADIKVTKASLQLPKQLGNIIVTIVRKSTRYVHQGKKVLFSF